MELSEANSVDLISVKGEWTSQLEEREDISHLSVAEVLTLSHVVLVNGFEKCSNSIASALLGYIC